MEYNQGGNTSAQTRPEGEWFSKFTFSPFLFSIYFLRWKHLRFLGGSIFKSKRNETITIQFWTNETHFIRKNVLAHQAIEIGNPKNFVPRAQYEEVSALRQCTYFDLCSYCMVLLLAFLIKMLFLQKLGQV